MDLEASIRDLFQRHRTEAFDGVFHFPSSAAANAISAWASAHHALILRHLEPEQARVELETLYRAAGREGGLLAHERVLDREKAAGDPLGVLLDEDGRSWLTGPPLGAFAAARLAVQLGEEMRPTLARATAQLDAIWSERLPPDTSLPVILHPLESATPGSPLYDPIVDAEDLEEWLDDLATLGRSALACQFDPARALRAGHPFVVEDPVFCGWFLLALEEVGRAWEGLGDEREATKLRIRSEMIAEAMSERLWWEEEQIYAGWDRGREEPLRGVTAGGIVPSASRTLLEEGTAKRALDRHLRPSTSPLWSAAGISFNPVVSDRSAHPEEVPWRGNAACAETHFWAHLALVRAQRVPDARVARSQLETRLAERGFREWYDPLTGAARGAGEPDGFTLPGIVLEMRAQEGDA